MKTISNINKYSVRLLSLLALGAILVADQAHAASVKLEVKVRGYTSRGTGWVLVLPELRDVLGGAVQWNSARQCYITDRVARGEVMRITILPSTLAEQYYRWALIGIAPGQEFYVNQSVSLPYVINDFEVSMNPNYDDVYVNILTTSGWYGPRLPIGSR